MDGMGAITSERAALDLAIAQLRGERDDARASALVQRHRAQDAEAQVVALEARVRELKDLLGWPARDALTKK